MSLTRARPSLIELSKSAVPVSGSCSCFAEVDVKSIKASKLCLMLVDEDTERAKESRQLLAEFGARGIDFGL